MGSDTWPVEVVPNADPTLVFPVHNELITKLRAYRGLRVLESHRPVLRYPRGIGLRQHPIGQSIYRLKPLHGKFIPLSHACVTPPDFKVIFYL